MAVLMQLGSRAADRVPVRHVGCRLSSLCLPCRLSAPEILQRGKNSHCEQRHVSGVTNDYGSCVGCGLRGQRILVLDCLGI